MIQKWNHDLKFKGLNLKDYFNCFWNFKNNIEDTKAKKSLFSSLSTFYIRIFFYLHAKDNLYILLFWFI